MSIKCLFGFHLWEGCKCSRCGQKRDEAHHWEDGICIICGKEKVFTANFEKVAENQARFCPKRGLRCARLP